jgi:dTDP-4-dehydrorhamnose 3,5-epimerase
MDFQKTEIDGLFIIQPKFFGDDRGWFMRTFSEDLFQQNIENFNSKWVQINHSFSKEKGTWRGLHFQNAPFQETKLIRCIAGKVIDYVLDIRKDSDTFLKSFSIELSEENKKMIFIPKGLAHGFLTLENNSQLIYLHDEYYNTKFEDGIRFNDSLINLEIRFSPIVVSERDKNHKLLSKNFKGI